MERECDVLVDGYNIIKNNPMFQFMEMKNRAEARALLIKQLRNLFMHTTNRVIVVFDGDGEREQVSHEDHIRIVYSRHGETADRVIARLATEAKQVGRMVSMYSNDGEVRQSVVEQGGTALTTRQLTSQLTAPSRDVALRSQHRQAMRRIYGIDPSYKPEDDEEPSYSSRKKKKKSSRRHR